MTNNRWRSWETMLLILLVFGTFFLRFYNASDISGGDDAQFAELGVYALQDPLKLIYPYYPDEPIASQGLVYSRPVAAMLYAGSILLLGYSKYAVIFPATVFSALSAIFLYLLVRRQFGRKIAVMSAALFTFSPFLLSVTRIGLLHSILIFFSLFSFWLLYRFLDTGKPIYIYIGALSWLLNAWTTDIRGLVPALAYGPILYSELKKRKTAIRFFNTPLFRHLVLSTIIATASYIAVLGISVIIFGHWGYVTNVFDMFLHAIGHMPGATELTYISLPEAAWLLTKSLFMTPMLGFLLVPSIFGIIISLRQRRPEQLFWIFYLIPIILFYLQAQNIPERQAIFIPAFSTLAAIGLIEVRRISAALLAFLTSAHLYSMVALFPSLFPVEWPALASLPYASLVPFMARFYIIGAALAILTAYVAWKIKEPGKWIFAVLALACIAFCFGAVFAGIPLFKRTGDVTTIGAYLKANTANDRYSCIGSVHSRTMTFYTQKPCLWWLSIDADWLIKHRGEVRYFLIDLQYKDGTVGLGRVLGNGLIDTENTYDDWWRKNYMEKYIWLVNNTVDVTAETGLSPDNPNFRLYVLKTG